MKIVSVTYKNFRCFGSIPTTVNMSKGITALVGGNGTGKTAVLEGLTRIFGLNSSQRQIRPSDFYTVPRKADEAIGVKDLFIEVCLGFPELDSSSLNSDYRAIAPTFHEMCIEENGKPPICRLRLEAKWSDDGTAEGLVEQKVFWILNTDEPQADNKNTCVLDPHDRSLIQVHYLPASRDASALVALASATMARRLLRAIRWPQHARNRYKLLSKAVGGLFGTNASIQLISEAIKQRWQELNIGHFDTDPRLSFFGNSFEDVIGAVELAFSPSELGEERAMRYLSDGQKSLFFFALTAAAFDVEGAVIQNAGKIIEGGQSGTKPQAKAEALFDPTILHIPALTIFAVEEPENHLSPFNLSRVIRQINSLVESDSAQALFSSHSPSVLSRIQPDNVRYFRIEETPRVAVVHPIKLPSDAESSAKYVREAVIAYPELYFAKFVILVEGDSEQVVLPRLASTLGLNIDPSYVAIVPLGGRHVNHFWKLLTDLHIPFTTLLDFDLGRDGAGWGRIKYACKQLIEVGHDRRDFLFEESRRGKKSYLKDDDLDRMHTRRVDDLGHVQRWLNRLEGLGIYYSFPLDIDMLMLSHYEEAYTSILGHGPLVTDKDVPRYADAMKKATEAVIGTGEERKIYENELVSVQRLFPWYRNLFLYRSKPATHLQALTNMDTTILSTNIPDVLNRLLTYVSTKINTPNF